MPVPPTSTAVRAVAKLSTSARKHLKSSDFAGPGHTFPDEDASHARDAIRMAAYSEEKGHISKSEEAHIDAKARAKLHEGQTHKHFNSHGLHHEAGTHHRD